MVGRWAQAALARPEAGLWRLGTPGAAPRILRSYGTDRLNSRTSSDRKLLLSVIVGASTGGVIAAALMMVPANDLSGSRFRRRTSCHDLVERPVQEMIRGTTWALRLAGKS